MPPERLEGRAETEPAGQVDPGLGPGEDPGDRPQVGDPRRLLGGGAASRAGASGRSRSQPERRDLVDRGDEPEEFDEAGIVEDERSVGLPRRGGQLVEDRPAARLGHLERRGMVVRRRPNDGRRQSVEMADRDPGIGVVLGDHLALLGDLETAVESTRREAEDRPVGRPAAAPDRPAATMEEGQLHAMAPGGRDERGLGAVDQPVRGEVARLLVRIGIAEHDFLAIAPPPDVLAVVRLGQDRIEDLARRLERRRVLEERDDVECQAAVRSDDPGRACELDDRSNVHGDRGEADDVALDRRLAEAALECRARPERIDDLGGRDARGRLSGGRAVARRRGSRLLLLRRQCRQRRPVDRAVLADLEAGEMEPERRQLPAEVLGLAPRNPAESVADERLLDLGDLRVELGGALVAAGRPASGAAARP